MLLNSFIYSFRSKNINIWNGLKRLFRNWKPIFSIPKLEYIRFSSACQHLRLKSRRSGFIGEGRRRRSPRVRLRCFPLPLAPYVLPHPAVLIGRGAGAVVMPTVNVLRQITVAFIPPRHFCTPLATARSSLADDGALLPRTAPELSGAPAL